MALTLGCSGADASTPDDGEALSHDSSADVAPVVDAGDDSSSDSGTPFETSVSGDVALDDVTFDTAPPKSNIEHVVVIVQENHSFDSYFGRWCTAPPGSAPTCTSGPSCCEAAPDKDENGTAPSVLDDANNAGNDHNHSRACELSEIDSGKMDRFTAGSSVSGCSSPGNFAIAPDAVVRTYHDYARKYALADRYFQPLAGASSANDMYFAVARWVFDDNAFKPASNGKGCINPTASTKTYSGVTTIADLLIAGGHPFGFYAEGYAAMLGTPFCPLPPSDCPEHIPTNPCDYDCSDVPFEYYDQFLDKKPYMKDYDELEKDLASELPALTFVKGLGYHNEHPGYGTKISDGVAFVSRTVDRILASKYGETTLILLTWDESGGLYDHVAPPPASSVDLMPYGARVPLLALGKFARAGTVSHVPMEHSSIVKFLEWNFLHATGQLSARDAAVNNLGSLLDPATTGVVVPEH